MFTLDAAGAAEGIYGVRMRFAAPGWIESDPVMLLLKTNDFDISHFTAATRAVVGAVPGDANLDGRANPLDLEIWRENLFQEQRTWLEADFNWDGAVDTRDFHIWWTSQAFDAATATLPEPLCGTWAYVISFMLCPHIFRRRNSRL
jgi:hypothetical protein